MMLIVVTGAGVLQRKGEKKIRLHKELTVLLGVVGVTWRTRNLPGEIIVVQERTITTVVEGEEDGRGEMMVHGGRRGDGGRRGRKIIVMIGTTGGVVIVVEMIGTIGEVVAVIVADPHGVEVGGTRVTAAHVQDMMGIGGEGMMNEESGGEGKTKEEEEEGGTGGGTKREVGTEVTEVSTLLHS